MDEILLSTLRLTTPLVFAAFGGLLSEKSGVANIALESFLLISAFTSAATTAMTGNMMIGVSAGILAAMIWGLLFCFICLKGKGDQIVIATGLNLFTVGFIPQISRFLFGNAGTTPSLSADLRFKTFYVFSLIAFVLAILISVMLKRTAFGLQLWSAGENPLAVESRGVSVFRTRMKAVVLGAAVTGIGGVMLSMCLSSQYARDMSAGRGYLGLAALIFGGWKPFPTLLGCFFFGFFDALQIYSQANEWVQIPQSFAQTIPFVVTLLAMVVSRQKNKAPTAINTVFE